MSLSSIRYTTAYAEGCLMNKGPVFNDLERLRACLDEAFAADTAAPGFAGSPPSRGHCAVVAIIMRELYGGVLLRTQVKGEEHWLNRIHLGDRDYDVDLTGDQFDFPPLQVHPAGQLYEIQRVDAGHEITPETVARALLLARRAKLNSVVVRIRERFGPALRQSS